jgi:hypothetical protein
MSLPLNHLSYYNLSDPVAANVGVMDKKDNYVSVVTSLNTWFGSKVIICLLHQKNETTNSPIHEFKVLYKDQRAF